MSRTPSSLFREQNERANVSLNMKRVENSSSILNSYHPLITFPMPIWKVKGSCPASFVLQKASERLPFFPNPVCVRSSCMVSDMWYVREWIIHFVRKEQSCSTYTVHCNSLSFTGFRPVAFIQDSFCESHFADTSTNLLNCKWVSCVLWKFGPVSQIIKWRPWTSNPTKSHQSPS